MADSERRHITVRLTKTSVEAMDALAAEMDLDRSDIIRMLLKRGLAEHLKDRRRVSGSTTR